MTTTAEKAKHTAAALRAANAINICEGDLAYDADINEWAEIIDHETGMREMIDTLVFAETILILLKREVEGLGFNAKNVFPRVKTAIMKARGEA